MVKKPISILLAASILLISCAPNTHPTQAAITTMAPTYTPIPTSTRPASATLNQDAYLYSGPGNVDFDILTTVKLDEIVYPSSIYGDFIEVSAEHDGQEFSGYVWKEVLASLPAGLPELTSEQAPWVPLFQPGCSFGKYVALTDQITFNNQTENWNTTEGTAIPLTAPLKINIEDITVDGNSGGVLKFTGIPESIHGDQWLGITRLDVGSFNGRYSISVFDGTPSASQVFLDLDLSTTRGIQILFDQPEGKSFHVLGENGHEVMFVDLAQLPGVSLPDGLFPNGEIYLGTVLGPQVAITITGLQIGIASSGSWVEDQTGYYSRPGLAELAAARGLTIGTEFAPYSSMDPRPCRTMQREFNVAVLSDFSWSGVWLGPGQYDFSYLDREVDYAVQQGWRMRASHLVWGTRSAIPDWLKDGTYTRDEYIQFLEGYIKDVVGRYQDRVQEWSVANEASTTASTPGADFWNDVIGPEYVAMAFRWAREADPDGILIFNDYNNHDPQDAKASRVIEQMYTTVQQLKADGVPIDGVGMQMHLFLRWDSQERSNKEDVIANMRRFAALGVRIFITELDVDLAYQPGTQAEKWVFEADIYRDMMEACLESGVCDSFTVWGISDLTSWIGCEFDWCIHDQNADPLLFDDDYNPKPAYFAVREALLSDLSGISAPTP